VETGLKSLVSVNYKAQAASFDEVNTPSGSLPLYFVILIIIIIIIIIINIIVIVLTFLANIFFSLSLTLVQ